MPPIIELVGPNGAVSFFGVKLVGFTLENARKLLLTLAVIGLLWIMVKAIRAVVGQFYRVRRDSQAVFWLQQAINLALTLLLVLGIVSIWFDDPVRLATGFGLVSAGLAFALQRVVTAVAGYFIILRGRIFNIGDRISMGGVKGDVIALGYTRTTIMEIGQPPSIEIADPAMWVGARQYTGRIVTITNDKIFQEPIYNYTREFPYLWEELRLPIHYSANRETAESILMEAANRHTVQISELSREALDVMARRYWVKPVDLKPRVYYRLTSNWLELTVRFVAREHGIRELKDAMIREILAALDETGISVASTTFEVVGLPPVRVQEEAPRGGTVPESG